MTPTQFRQSGQFWSCDPYVEKKDSWSQFRRHRAERKAAETRDAPDAVHKLDLADTSLRRDSVRWRVCILRGLQQYELVSAL